MSNCRLVIQFKREENYVNDRLIATTAYFGKTARSASPSSKKGWGTNDSLPMSSLARVLFAANNKISRRLLNAGNTLHNPAEINKLYMYRSRNAKKISLEFMSTNQIIIRKLKCRHRSPFYHWIITSCSFSLSYTPSVFKL